MTSAPTRPSAPTLTALRVASLVETTSYLVLLTAVLARALGTADLVSMMGLGHGVIYLVYAALVLAARASMRWTGEQTAQALIIAAVPLGALVVHRDVVRRAAAIGGSAVNN